MLGEYEAVTKEEVEDSGVCTGDLSSPGLDPYEAFVGIPGSGVAHLWLAGNGSIVDNGLQMPR